MSYAEAQYIIDEAAKVNGLPPDPVAISLFLRTSSTTVNLTFAPPSDTVIDGVTVCTVGGVLIVGKLGSAPKKPSDGTIIANLDRTHMSDYVSSPLEITFPKSEESYFVAIFSYSDHGVVNYKAKVTEIKSGIYKFAYHQDFTELDPDKTITYLNWGDLDSGSSPMHTNSDTGTVTYGDFKNFFILTENKPYMVKSDYTADYALDPTDYTKKLDGSVSDVSNTSYSGLGAFAWIPKFYMKEVYAADGNSRDVYFSNEQEDEDFHPVGFVDYSVGEVKGLWIPMYYPGSDGKSIAGRTGYNVITNKKTGEQKTIIDLNGANARFFGGSIMNALRDLMYGLYKSTNIQERGGYGNCKGYNSSDLNKGYTTNPVLSNGVVSGFKGTGNSSDESTRKQANKAFHSNVLFTYDMRLRDPYTLFYTTGYRIGTVRIRSKYTYNISGNTSDTNDVTFASSVSRQRQIGYSSKLEISDSGNGQKQSINYGNEAASDSTGLCDYDSWSSVSTYNKTYAAIRMGYCFEDLRDGPAFLDLNYEPSVSASSIGAAPLIIPPANYTPS